MTDLVERLRQSTDPVRHEAADEIEHLRAEIESLRATIRSALARAQRTVELISELR
jgi:hypothetical protein